MKTQHSASHIVFFVYKLNVLDEVKQQFLAMIENQASNGGWIEWVHESGKPAMTSEEKTENVTLSGSTQHCAMCANLNGCQFLKSKMPFIPLHKNCHCKTKSIATPAVIAECDVRKFTEYVFDQNIGKNKGKKTLFEN